MPPRFRFGRPNRAERIRGHGAGEGLGNIDPSVVRGARGSVLCERILEMWSWGYISAPVVQYLCEGAVRDGNTHPGVAALAEIGSSGRWQQNCQRDIATNFYDDIGTPNTYVVDVPAKNPKVPALGRISVPCHLLLPHQLFAWVCKEFPQFVRSATNNGALEDFWNGAEATGDPHLANHIVKSKAGWKSRAIPLVLYGDGARFAKHDSLEIACMSFLLSKESTWSSKMVMAAFVSSAEWGEDTWQCIWRVLAWSLGCVFAGKHPLRDHMGREWPVDSVESRLAGTPLSQDGFFGVVHRYTGDLDWYAKRLRLAVAPGANKPCCWCQGARPGHGPPFLDLRRTAAWIGTPALPLPANAAFDVPGATVFGISHDEMHTMDLGVLAHFEASCIHTMVFEGGLPGTIDERGQHIWQRIQHWYNRLKTPTRLTRLKRSFWSSSPDNFPCMTTKAAENRHLPKA